MTSQKASRERARRVVRLVTCILPAGQARERYRQEFLAELFGLNRISRICFVLGLVSTSFALRAALRDAPSVDGPISVAPSKPVLCRTGLHHRWRTYLNPDGEAYRHCTRCGADRYDGMGKPNGAGNLAGNMVMPGW